MENKYVRGSVWRRWDLHIHTKNTAKNDQFKSSDFESFCIDLFTRALKNKISVIGITDYFSVDNYKKIIDFVEKIDNISDFSSDEKEAIKGIFILPNVELRMLPVTDNSKLVNIHCIFNPSFVNDLDNNFFGAIEFSHGPGKKYLMNRQGMIDLGKNLDQSLPNDIERYKKGVSTFVVSPEQLQKLYDENSNFRENVIIVVSNSNQDGASGFQQHYDFFEDKDFSSLEALRQSIYYISHAIFSGNESDSKYFLGDKKDKADDVIKKCGSLKPCMHGSDAHKEEDLFLPKNNKFCWIKADPTFEGLKQIIYEPGERIKIQELEPEDKEDYFIIDKVKFIDDNFFPGDIYLNQNLTAIIGGKSTGKSILLRNIAQSIDPKEVDYRISEVGIEPYPKQISEFKVFWRDRQENKKSETEELNKKIIYIPQSYLNRLVDKKEDKSSIDEIIKNVLYQDDVAKKVFNSLDSSTRDLEKAITKNIEDIFYTKDDIDRSYEAIKKIGDKKGVSAEIDKLKTEISILKNSSGMTEADIKKYDQISVLNSELKNKRESIEKNLIGLQGLIKKDIFSTISFGELSPGLGDLLSSELSSIKKKATKEWIDFVENKANEVKDSFKENSELIEKNNTELAPLLAKVAQSKALDEKIKKLDFESKKLNEILKKDSEFIKLRQTYENLIKELIENHSKFYENLFLAKSEILKQNVIVGELEFNMDVSFENIRFQNEFIDEVCNLRNIGKFNEVLLREYKFTDVSSLKNDVEKIIEGLLSSVITLKNNYSQKEAITRLVKNWFIFDFKIKQNGDEIAEMSPGKKSFVLLKLLIELDNSKCPILLDQPEDDLDNRSIYNDLVQFIKTKKKERQIIIATHNPNLVVGADAECIIVANQKGETSSSNQIYKFEYIEGSLENSFYKTTEDKILHKQGIQEHVCDILEGGKKAFEKRKKKYNFK